VSLTYCRTIHKAQGATHSGESFTLAGDDTIHLKVVPGAEPGIEVRLEPHLHTLVVWWLEPPKTSWGEDGWGPYGDAFRTVLRGTQTWDLVL
jgi:hypothetical protein